MTELSFRNATLEDVPLITMLERESYPSEEAATEEQIRKRVLEAQDFFRLCFKEGELIGFINGTLVKGSLNEESMSFHTSEGNVLCIHSVVTAENHRRKKYATRQLAQYLLHVGKITHKYPKLESIELLSKQEKLKLYQNMGFLNLGESGVEHGEDKWLRCLLKIAK